MGQISAVRMETARNRSCVAPTTIVGSRAWATLSAAAENGQDTARKARVIVTLMMSALVRLCVASMPADMIITLWIAAANNALR